MSDDRKATPDGREGRQAERKARLSDALRANLRRRRAQAKAREVAGKPAPEKAGEPG